MPDPVIKSQDVLSALGQASQALQSRPGGGLAGIAQGVVEGLAESTLPGRVFLEPLNSVTTNRERQAAISRAGSLAELYRAQQEVELAPLRAESARLGVASQQQNLEFGKAQEARAEKASAMSEDATKQSMALRRAAEERDVKQFNDNMYALRSKESDAYAMDLISQGFQRAFADLDGGTGSMWQNGLTDEDRKILYSSPGVQPLRDVYSVMRLYTQGFIPEAKRKIEALGGSVEMENGAPVIFYGDNATGQVFRIEATQDNFNAIHHQLATRLKDETDILVQALAAKRSITGKEISKIILDLRAEGHEPDDIRQVLSTAQNMAPPQAWKEYYDLMALQTALTSPNGAEVADAQNHLMAAMADFKANHWSFVPSEDGDFAKTKLYDPDGRTLLVGDFLKERLEANAAYQSLNTATRVLRERQKAVQALEDARAKKRAENTPVQSVDPITGLPRVRTQAQLVEEANAPAKPLASPVQVPASDWLKQQVHGARKAP